MFNPVWKGSSKLEHLGNYVLKWLLLLCYICRLGGVKSACKDSTFHFCNLNTSGNFQKAFLDLKLRVLQFATSNSQNWDHFVAQNSTFDTP